MGDFAEKTRAYQQWTITQRTTPEAYEEWLDIDERAAKWNKIEDAMNDGTVDMFSLIDLLIG